MGHLLGSFMTGVGIIFYMFRINFHIFVTICSFLGSQGFLGRFGAPGLDFGSESGGKCSHLGTFFRYFFNDFSSDFQGFSRPVFGRAPGPVLIDFWWILGSILRCF